MKKNNFVLLVVSLFLLCVFSKSLLSQPSTLWAKIYNGPANLQDSSVAMNLSPAGMLFVTGWSLGSGTSSDIVTIRYNPETGDSIWVKRFVGALEDRVNALTSDNNAAYVTGWSFTPSRDIITIKYNATNGDTMWVKKFNGTGNGGDYGFGIAVDGSGNVYVCGRSDVGSGNGQKYTILKYDASGNMAAGFPVIYNDVSLSTLFDQAYSIKVDGSGGIYVTGKSGLAGTENFLTLKLNSSGVVQWAKKHNGSFNAEDNALALVLDNTAANVYVAGYGFRSGTERDFVVIRYNAATGDSTAYASYDGAGSLDVLLAMTIDNANNIYVTGPSTGASTGLDYATIKYNPNLVQQWVNRTTNSGNDLSNSIAVDNASGNVYVTGSSLGGTLYDYLTLSINGTNGQQRWEKRENGTSNSNDYASYVATSDTDHIFVTGSANFSGTGVAFLTLRYAKVVGINPISGTVPGAYSLKQNYPNPFNPVTSIRFDIPKSSFVKISVFDMLGREVEVLANENVSAGQYEVQWDAAKYASGIYFYTLSANDFKETKKMILTK